MRGEEQNETTLAVLAVQVAQSQLGQEEQPRGSNRGVMVDKYLKAVGLGPGYAWCQAFVYWCYEQAARQAGDENPMVRTAGVYDSWNRTGRAAADVARMQRLTREDMIKQCIHPQPGDQLVLLYAGGKGHTALVEAVDAGDPWLMHTIEGNSNAGGSREGYAVVRRKRNMSEAGVRGVIRYR